MGVPTRFGNFPAQWKAFWDSTSGLWAGGKYGNEERPALFGVPVVYDTTEIIPYGAWAGAYFSDSNQLEDAVLGGLGGLALSNIPVSKAVGTLKKLAAPDARLNINELADAHEKYTKLAAVDVWSLQKQIEGIQQAPAQ